MGLLLNAMMGLFLAGFSSLAMAAAYTVDGSHSIVGFSVKHLVISKVKGQFKKAEGSFDFDEKKNEISKVDIKIDVASVDTNDKKRDEHLSSADFFDAKKFPQITFKAGKASVKKGETTKLPGTLTIRGVSKPVVMELTYNGSTIDPWKNEKSGFSLTGKINRQDYGISWNKALDKGGVAVSDEVVIEVEGEATKTSEATKTK